MKKLLSVILAAVIALSPVCVAAGADLPDAWAKDKVNTAIAAGIVPAALQRGYIEDCLRIDFCKLAVALIERARGGEIADILQINGVAVDPNAFYDTSDPDVLAANALGIVGGVEVGRFDSNGEITREQAATMIMRTAAFLEVKEGKIPQGYYDMGSVSDYAKDAVSFVSSLGIMNGVDEGIFSPKTSYSKQQAIVTHLRLFEVQQSGIAPPKPEPKPDPKPDGKELSASEIFKLCSPAVFKIGTYNESGQPILSGSGFVIEASGVAVTNYHVIEGAASATAWFPDGTSCNVAGILAADKAQDIAIIKLSSGIFKTLKQGNSDKAQVGDKIYTLGSPMGYDNTISEGIISNIGRDFESDIQISAPISHGSSGGALLNRFGEVIGITTSGVEEGQNLNFAIPIKKVSGLKRGELQPLGKGTEPTPPESLWEIEPNNIYSQAQFLPIDTQCSGVIDDDEFDLYKIVCDRSMTIVMHMLTNTESELMLCYLNDDDENTTNDHLACKEYTITESGRRYFKTEVTIGAGTHYIGVLSRYDGSVIPCEYVVRYWEK